MADETSNVEKNRTRPTLDLSGLPKFDPDFRRTDPEVLRRILLRLPESLIAESVAGLLECAGRGAQLAADFANSKKIPHPDELAKLATRIETLQQGKAHLLFLLGYYEELEDIALSDAMGALNNVHEEYEYFVTRDANLQQEYPRMLAFQKARRELVARGREEAKRQRAKDETSPK